MKNNINHEYIINYIRDNVPGRNELLVELEKFAKEHRVPIIEPETGQFIRTLIGIIKPKKILEIGTAIGYSALLMADSNDEVEIITVERDEKMKDIAIRNIESSIYADRIELMYGDANEVLNEVTEEFDMVFIDAAKGQYKKFFDKSLELLSEDGVIISDNVLFKGMVANDDLVEKRVRTIVNRLREYIIYINELEGLTTSIIPIGDGVALTYREEKICE